MQSRLAELKGSGAGNGGSAKSVEMRDVEKGLALPDRNASDTESSEEVSSRSDSVDGTTQEEDAMDEELREFFDEVGKVKRELSKIKTNIRTVREMYDQQLMSVSLDAKEETSTSQDLEKVIDETNFAASKVTQQLKRMDEANKQIPEKERGYASGRIRINMHGTLTKQFLDLMKEYQGLQTDYKNRHKENFERRYRMVKPDVTQDQIDAALESGTGSEIFAEQILDTRHAKAKEALAYVENKHRDIVKLEASIRELHQLFVEMAVLVEAQGALIDHIESNLDSARNYTRVGVKELHKANINQKKSRKNMCCLAICLLILLGIGALLLGIFAP